MNKLNFNKNKILKEIDIFSDENISRYRLEYSKTDKYPENLILVEFDEEPFEEVLNMFLCGLLKDDAKILFLNVLKYCLNNATLETENGIKTSKYTKEEIDFLLEVLNEGYDFRWLTCCSLDSMKKIFEEMKKQREIINNGMYYNKNKKLLLQETLLSKKNLEPLFRIGYWSSFAGIEYTKFLYNLGYNIVEGEFHNSILLKDDKPLCILNKDLVDYPYLRTLKDLVKNDINIEPYLKANANSVHIKVHIKISSQCNISIEDVMKLDNQILGKFLECKPSKLGEYSHKLMKEMEKQYNVILDLNNKLYRK